MKPTPAQQRKAAVFAIALIYLLVVVIAAITLGASAIDA